jgi:hypothetical protein
MHYGIGFDLTSAFKGLGKSQVQILKKGSSVSYTGTFRLTDS